jgi:hypothetical protein
VTIDQLTVAGDAAALVLRWSEQGRAAREEVWRLRHGRLEQAVAGPASCPRWAPGGGLAVTVGSEVRMAGATLVAGLDGLHSFDWLPGDLGGVSGSGTRSTS